MQQISMLQASELLQARLAETAFNLQKEKEEIDKKDKEKKEETDKESKSKVGALTENTQMGVRITRSKMKSNILLNGSGIQIGSASKVQIQRGRKSKAKC